MAAAQCLLSLILSVSGSRRARPFLKLLRRFPTTIRLWGGGPSAPAGFAFFVLRNKDSGRWESGKPAFGFPVFHRPRRRRCGNVGISPAVGEISKGLVERGGSLPLAFHAFHSPGIST